MPLKRFFVSTVLVLISSPFFAAGTSTDLQKRLLSGEVLAYAALNDEGVEGVKVVFSIDTQKENIWKTITDYNHFKEIFGDIRMELVYEDRNGARVNASLLIFDYVLYHRYDIYGEKLTWFKESGDLEVVTGSWTIVDSIKPGVQLIYYESYLDAGNSFYNWLAHSDREERGKDIARKLRRYIKETYGS